MEFGCHPIGALEQSCRINEDGIHCTSLAFVGCRQSAELELVDFIEPVKNAFGVFAAKLAVLIQLLDFFLSLVGIFGILEHEGLSVCSQKGKAPTMKDHPSG